jgi:Tfp pilus assembly protein PilN
VYFDCPIIAEDSENAMIHVLLVVIKKTLLDPFLHLFADSAVNFTSVAIASTAAGAFLRNVQAAGKANCLFLIHPVEGQLVFSVFEKGRLRYMTRTNYRAKAGSPDESVSQHIRQIIDEAKTAFGPMTTAVHPAAAVSKQLSDLLSESNIDLISVDVERSGLPDEQYMIAFGAALDPYATGTENLNLLPESLQKKPSRLGYFVFCFLVSVLVICAMIYGGSLFYLKKQAINRLNIEIESLQEQIADAGSIQDKYDRIAGRLKHLNDFGGNAQLIEILRELSTILPQDSWLNEFRMTGNEIRIDGFSDSAVKLIGLIENSSLFDNARFLSTIRKAQGNKERFQIGMEVEPNG